MIENGLTWTNDTLKDEDGFDEWYRENEERFHSLMFTAEEIALAAWYAGAKQILMIQMRNRVPPPVSEDSG